MSQLPSWSGAKRVAVDVETCDPHLTELGPGPRRPGGRLVGVAFAIEDGPRHYLPMRHAGGDNLPVEEVQTYLRANASAFNGDVVGAKLEYDLDWLWQEKIEFGGDASYRDIQIADPLIYELHDRYSMDHIAKRYGIPLKDEEMLRRAASEYRVDPKKGLHLLPGRYVGQYGEGDVDRPLHILRRQERVLEEQDLWRIWNLECQVLPILVKMRRRGIRVNLQKLEKIESWTLAQEAECYRIVKEVTGLTIGTMDINKARALAPVLEHIGLKLEKTESGEPNIDKAVLASVNHPVTRAIGQARKVNKLRTTFAASVRKYGIPDGENYVRIHSTFNQIARETEKGDQKGVRYGRLSSIDPNLQQQPARDEFANTWRDIYEPEEGAVLGAPDYSQQEPRWTTHYAAVSKLTGAEEAARAYRENPDLDNHDFMTRLVYGDAVDSMEKDVYKRSRGRCKNIYLGLCYGEGGGKLSHDLGLPSRWALSVGKWPDRKVLFFEGRSQALEARRNHGEGFVWEAAGEEAQAILDQFNEKAPFIKELAKKAEGVAKKRGYVVTVGGRHLHFPQRQDGSYDWTHKALNRIIQGSSADQMKTAMVQIHREMPEAFIQLQVHDELVGSFASHDEGKRVAKIMRECIPDTLVPFKVDLEMGPSWGNLKDVA